MEKRLVEQYEIDKIMQELGDIETAHVFAWNASGRRTDPENIESANVTIWDASGNIVGYVPKDFAAEAIKRGDAYLLTTEDMAYF